MPTEPPTESIELSPGQEVPLVTADGAAVSRLRVGLGWDAEPNAGIGRSGRLDVDLDATAVQFTGRDLFDLAFYNNLATRDGSVVHQGDNKTGAGDGDDEVVVIDLDRVHKPVDSVVLLVSSYQGQALTWVDRAYCRVVDDATDTEIARLTLTAGVDETGLAMARVVRGADGWSLRALGEGVAVTRPGDHWQKLRRFL